MPRRAKFLSVISFVVTALAGATPPELSAQRPPQRAASDTGRACPNCAEWNAPHRPFRIHGNTYWVGTHGLGSILVTSSAGHVLIDGGLPESAPSILASIRSLGFDPKDVRIILNSHVHFDHAGGIGELARATGAIVAASPSTAAVLQRGKSGPDDPQFGLLQDIAPVPSVRTLADREVVRVGPLALTAYFTGGHTPGGTSWTWPSCENNRCVEIVYGDSQTAVSADGFRYSRNTTYPNAVKDFERGFAALETLQCDILLTPHPSASQLWERVAARDSGNASALVDRTACKRYAANARKALAARLAREK